MRAFNIIIILARICSHTHTHTYELRLFLLIIIIVCARERVVGPLPELLSDLVVVFCWRHVLPTRRGVYCLENLHIAAATQ